MTQTQSAVQALVKAHGLYVTAKHLGISLESLKNVYGGLPVRAGTLLLVEQGLKKSPPKPKKRPQASARKRKVTA